MLIAFTNITDHSEAEMVEIVQQTLKEFEIVGRVGCLTMDNASNNNTLMSGMENSSDDYCIRKRISKA